MLKFALKARATLVLFVVSVAVFAVGAVWLLSSRVSRTTLNGLVMGSAVVVAGTLGSWSAKEYKKSMRHSITDELGAAPGLMFGLLRTSYLITPVQYLRRPMLLWLHSVVWVVCLVGCGVALPLALTGYGPRAYADTDPGDPRHAVSITGELLWYTSEKPLLCIVGPDSGKAAEAGDNVLYVYAETVGKYRQIFKSSPEERMLGMYPVGGGQPRLVTIWGAGDHFDIHVFAQLDGVVKEVLADGSRIPPEVIYSDPASRNESILISDMSWVKAQTGSPSKLLPTTTRIYLWDGEQYLMKTVPWKERLSGSTAPGAAH